MIFVGLHPTYALKKLYKGKSLEQMSEKEVDKMLEDLI